MMRLLKISDRIVIISQSASQAGAGLERLGKRPERHSWRYDPV
jgi:hypothetical protein